MNFVSISVNLIAILFTIIIFNVITFKSFNCIEKCPRMDVGIMFSTWYCEDGETYKEITFREIFWAIIILQFSFVFASIATIGRNAYYSIIHSILTVTMVSQVVWILFSEVDYTYNNVKCIPISIAGYNAARFCILIITVGWYTALLLYAQINP